MTTTAVSSQGSTDALATGRRSRPSSPVAVNGHEVDVGHRCDAHEIQVG